jgi:hypothetical protein
LSFQITEADFEVGFVDDYQEDAAEAELRQERNERVILDDWVSIVLTFLLTFLLDD